MANPDIAWDMNPEQGRVEEKWPPGLPRPPSMKKLQDETQDNSVPMCVVFNANTREGATMFRVLSDKGLRVVAVVRVITGPKTKELIKLKRVVVKMADGNDKEQLSKAADGCERAFLVTKYWDMFENQMEEQMANNALEAAADVGVKHFVMVAFENAVELQNKKMKSQLVPGENGRILPKKFEGMKDIHEKAKKLGISLSHMMTSYLDQEGLKKSLVLIRGPRGKLIAESQFKGPFSISAV